PLGLRQEQGRVQIQRWHGRDPARPRPWCRYRRGLCDRARQGRSPLAQPDLAPCRWIGRRMVTIDANRLQLGEGPGYDPATDLAWWFDIPGKRLFLRSLSQGETQVHDLP